MLPTTLHLLALLASGTVAAPLTLPRGILLGSSFGVPGQAYNFDYLVVGGGNAGLTVAARLAENPALLVGVVEAGGFYELTNGNISQVPSTDIYYAGKDQDDWQPGIDWGIITTPQTGLLGAAVHYPRGKTLGGSSARNYMTYHLPTAGSLDLWADRVGDSSYSFANFLPYYMKSQKFTPPNQSKRLANATPCYDTTTLGTTGPLSVIFPNYAGAFATWVVKGLSSIGITPINGFTSGKLIGSAYALGTINYNTNTRDSSETAFLDPLLVKSSPNLIVFPNTLAKKILFDSAKKATGVSVNTQGLTYTLSVKREVILSAGAFQSPQLLMVSGIGPAATLTKYGIPVIADRPGVGQNMSDHVLFGTTFRVNVITGSALGNSAYANQAVADYKKGTGPLTNPNVDIFGWEKLPRANLSATTQASLAQFPADWPEIEYIFPGGYFGYSGNYQKNNPTDGYNYATIAAGLITTLSYGTVSIASADSAVLPIVNPNWLTHPADKESAIASFKRTRQIWNSPAMKDVVIGDEYFPGTKNVSTDAQIWTFIQKSFSTIFHAAGTCRMGTAGDANAVVDAQARVMGVSGLRVVDASSFPFLPPGHPMSTVYALAEKISADILAAL
ncbi:oxidoreductase [Calycina marina]|uniref:Oxidoreductase n=1 Tax=Calycina marina TaxID=1763456 RepID=A0A9P7Z3M7_9HELO|nr:oxidoreductase [Calycina marina]